MPSPPMLPGSLQTPINVDTSIEMDPNMKATAHKFADLIVVDDEDDEDDESFEASTPSDASSVHDSDFDDDEDEDSEMDDDYDPAADDSTVQRDAADDAAEEAAEAAAAAPAAAGKGGKSRGPKAKSGALSASMQSELQDELKGLRADGGVAAWRNLGSPAPAKGVLPKSFSALAAQKKAAAGTRAGDSFYSDTLKKASYTTWAVISGANAGWRSKSTRETEEIRAEGALQAMLGAA